MYVHDSRLLSNISPRQAAARPSSSLFSPQVIKSPSSLCLRSESLHLPNVFSTPRHRATGAPGISTTLETLDSYFDGMYTTLHYTTYLCRPDKNRLGVAGDGFARPNRDGVLRLEELTKGNNILGTADRGTQATTAFLRRGKIE